jgi:hypothetical protein
VIPRQVRNEPFGIGAPSCDESQSTVRIPAGKTLNLAITETTLAVVDDQIGIRPIIRRWQWLGVACSNHRDEE